MFHRRPLSTQGATSTPHRSSFAAISAIGHAARSFGMTFGAVAAARPYVLCIGLAGSQRAPPQVAPQAHT
jgi:hypothetical protein